jgi:hypothetical protein
MSVAVCTRDGASRKYNGQRIYNGKGVHKKKISESFPMFFVIFNITACPSSPDAREPVFVVITIDHPRKKKSIDAKGKCWSWYDKRWTSWREVKVTLCSSFEVVA